MKDNVINLQSKLCDEIAVSGELVLFLCPICFDQKAPFIPVVGINARDKKTFIAALVCASEKCDGNTILYVNDGYISEDVRILEPEEET